MQTERVHLKMPEPMIAAAAQIARDRDITVGQLIRDLVATEIGRRDARPPVRADERLIAPVRARLASDLAHANGWDDLQERLTGKGYKLRAAGGGLAMHDHPGDQRICKASELGFSYTKLMRRFGSPFPDQPTHGWWRAIWTRHQNRIKQSTFSTISVARNHRARSACSQV